MSENIKSVYVKFKQIIGDFQLLDLEMHDVKVWHYSQFEIFNQILKKLDIFDHAHSSTNSVDTIKSIPSVIFNAAFKSPHRFKGNAKVLIFNHPRKMLIENQYVDIYTKYYVDEISDDYLVVEKPYMNRHYSNKNEKKTKYLDDLKLMSKVKVRFSNMHFTQKEISKINKIEHILFISFGIKINLITLFKRNIKRFQVNYTYYDRLLKKIQPEKILLVVSYSFMELISAAKNNNIQTVEIQHGVITPYSITYNFEDRVSPLEYFPDKILVFGDYWKKSVNFPIAEEALIASGFPFLESQVEKYKNQSKNPKKILFISQGTIGRELLSSAVNLAKHLPEYKIIYKLHPGEYSDWKEKYCEKLNCDDISNFDIIDTNKIDIYSLFSTSNIVVGVYSTAIYEALAFGCKCVLVDLPGVEYMERLIADSKVLIAKDTKDLVNKVLNIDSNMTFINSDHFFSSNSYKKALLKAFRDNS